MSRSSEDRTVTVDGVVYKHGDKVIVNWGSSRTQVEAKVNTKDFDLTKYSKEDEKNGFHLCQNKESGNYVKENFGYKYTWIIVRPQNKGYDSFWGMRHAEPQIVSNYPIY